ncbi:MAG: phage major capsid protein [Actinomycetia bacterium]|nr:phage major capsid protein [Actinomycetes bacterium]
MTVVVDDITIPDTPAALEEFLADPKNVAGLLKVEGKFEEFVGKYAKVVLDKNVDIQAQVTDQVERTMAEFLKGQKDEGFVPVDLARSMATPASKAQARADFRRGLNNPRAQGAQLDDMFDGVSGMADFMQLIWHNGDKDAKAQAKLSKIRNAFSSTEGADGGFLIPEVLRSEILRVGLETGIVRNRARIVPMEALRVAFPMIDSTSNVSSVHGGIVSYWEQEGATHTDVSPEFGSIALQARKLVSYTTVPNEMVMDAPGALQMFIGELFPEAVAFEEDYAFLTGSGVGEPLGSLKTDNPGIISVAKETGQAASTIYWENIVKMYSRMLPQSLNRAVWVVSHDLFPELATMALSVGTGGVPVWLPDGTSTPMMQLLGRPVIPSEKTPAALGTRGDISFVDFGFYLVGDRQMMSASSSPHVNFTSDKTAFKIINRCDGRPWLQSPITPRNQGSTLGYCVQLDTRA